MTFLLNIFWLFFLSHFLFSHKDDEDESCKREWEWVKEKNVQQKGKILESCAGDSRLCAIGILCLVTFLGLLLNNFMRYDKWVASWYILFIAKRKFNLHSFSFTSPPPFTLILLCPVYYSHTMYVSFLCNHYLHLVLWSKIDVVMRLFTLNMHVLDFDKIKIQ